MTIYVYTLGVAIEAEDEQAAWAKLAPISQQLDALDVERDSSVDGPSLWESSHEAHADGTCTDACVAVHPAHASTRGED